MSRFNTINAAVISRSRRIAALEGRSWLEVDTGSPEGNNRLVSDKLFEEWYNEANAYLIGKAGVGIEDLADGDAWSAWDAGLTPSEHAEDLLESEGFYAFA